MEKNCLEQHGFSSNFVMTLKVKIKIIFIIHQINLFCFV